MSRLQDALIVLLMAALLVTALFVASALIG